MPNENHKPDQPLAFGCNNLLGPLPEPDGWIYDGHPDGLQFRRQAITGIEALARSSAPMFSAHQMRAYAAQEVAAERARRLPDVDELAQHIRWLNGSNNMGAGRLAEKLLDWLRSRA